MTTQKCHELLQLTVPSKLKEVDLRCRIKKNMMYFNALRVSLGLPHVIGMNRAYPYAKAGLFKATTQTIRSVKMKSRIQLKVLALTAGLFGMSVLATTAQAAVVTQWSYSTNAVFSNASFSDGSGVQISNPSELSWGRSPTLNPAGNFQNPGTDPFFNRSALTVGNFAASPETKVGGGPATGSIATDMNGILTTAEIGKGISLTHWNNVLDGARATLLGATITDTITLTPQLPVAGSALTGPTLTFSFNFRETPNDGNNNGVCADGLSAVGNYGYSAAGGGCPDLFGFTTTSVVNQSFVYDNVTYFASVLFLNADGSLDSIGIPQLLAGECSALGFGSTTCFGFKTFERQATTKRFGVAISAEPLPVPEPGTLALMGLAILGLGAIRARKSS